MTNKEMVHFINSIEYDLICAGTEQDKMDLRKKLTFKREQLEREIQLEKHHFDTQLSY